MGQPDEKWLAGRPGTLSGILIAVRLVPLPVCIETKTGPAIAALPESGPHGRIIP